MIIEVTPGSWEGEDVWEYLRRFEDFGFSLFTPMEFGGLIPLSRSVFDQLAELSNSWVDHIEVVMMRGLFAERVAG
jgi:hypothetical protein